MAQNDPMGQVRRDARRVTDIVLVALLLFYPSITHAQKPAGDPKLQALTEQLRDTHPHKRAAAARALGNLGPAAAAAAALERSLKDRSGSVSGVAATALRKIRGGKLKR